MAEPQVPLFAQLRGVVGGYLIDVILEEGGEGIALLIREGLEHKAKLEADDAEKVMLIVQRLE